MGQQIRMTVFALIACAAFAQAPQVDWKAEQAETLARFDLLDVRVGSRTSLWERAAAECDDNPHWRP